MTDSYAFVGDIHGVLAPVVEVVERAQDEAETLVFLGDYVNRGSESSAVLAYLINLGEKLGDRVHFLAGHHDLAFRNAIDYDRLDTFLRMGGAATLSSYPRTDTNGRQLALGERVPASHAQFLRNLRTSFTADGCVAMHDQVDSPAGTSLFGVFGHRLQPGAVPLVTKEFALIDTGCGTLPNGRLTSFQWPSKTWFQSS